jgi:hypothetical protein
MIDTTEQYDAVEKVMDRSMTQNPDACEYVPSALRRISVGAVMRDHPEWSESELGRVYDEVNECGKE